MNDIELMVTEPPVKLLTVTGSLKLVAPIPTCPNENAGGNRVIVEGVAGESSATKALPTLFSSALCTPPKTGKLTEVVVPTTYAFPVDPTTAMPLA